MIEGFGCTRALAVMAAVCWLGTGCTGGAPDAPPNVLLVTLDTLRADYIGTYGFEAETTPFIDALAERSVVFERAIAASARTAPSHASILTSRWVRYHSIGHVNGTTRLLDEPTLAEQFAAAGYDTAAFVSNPLLTRRIGLDRGFDVYDDELSVSARSGVVERDADATSERAEAWLGAERDRPWFAWVHFQDPHGPYTAPPPFERVELRAQPDEVPLPPLSNPSGYKGIPDYQVLEGVHLPSEYRSRYAGEIRYVDAAVGRIVAAAENSSPPRPLVLLLTADHGESLGEYGFWFAHGFTTMPEQTHVPLVLMAPGLKPQRRSELVHHVDILPTLLHAAGLPVPETAQGVALGPLLSEALDAWPDRIVFADIGTEVGAFQQDRMVRVFLFFGIGRKDPSSWEHWRWESDGSMTRREEDMTLRAPVSEYIARQPPLNETVKIDPAQAKRLRALGYLDPESNR